MANAMANAMALAMHIGHAPIPIPITTSGRLLLLLTDTRAKPEGNDHRMTTSSGWCLTHDHANCKYPDCGCSCHGQVEGQDELFPDERTMSDVPF